MADDLHIERAPLVQVETQRAVIRLLMAVYLMHSLKYVAKC